MARIKSPFLRVGVHVLLIVWVLYSVLPFGWTLLNSIKRPVDANARIPKIIGFQATSKNYADLWLNMPAEEFAPIGIGLLVFLAALIGFAVWSSRRSALSGPGTALVVVVGLVAAAEILPRVANMAEFYNYFLNSVIVTVGTLLVSISIGCLGGYGLARYSGILSVVILVAALGFRALPRMAFVLPYYYLGQLSGLYDTHLLLILTLVAVNQPFTIWMLRSFFMEIPREIEEAAMMDGAGRLQSFIRVIIPITWPGIITTSLFTLLLAYNEFLLARILTQSNWTLPVAIAQYTSGEDASYITIAAAASVSIALPIIFVIIFFQKYLIKGLASGAVKG
ncbi:MAG: carbohydrate ABC transporter permease [Anaerolineae bacterium]|nr:carbohydrate ABC transporter permease [Anaerolineae bacterium]